LTCKEAWRRIHHKVLTKRNVWKTAMNGMVEPHVPMLRWCMRHEIARLYRNGVDIGATGNMSLIEEYLATYGNEELGWTFVGAAKAGVARVALSLHSRLDAGALDEVCGCGIMLDVSEGGLIEVAQLLHLPPSDWDCRTIEPALRNGHLPFVQWVLSETTLSPVDGEYAVTVAAESGSVDLVRWFVEEKGFVVNDEPPSVAASAGHLDVLRWLHARVGCSLHPLMSDAVCTGQLHVLEWLVEQGCALTEETLYEAARTSTATTVAWLLDRGCPYVQEALVESSCRNITTSDVLKFLVETKHMRHIPESCKAAALASHEFDEAALHSVFGVQLSDYYLVNCVLAEDVGRLRYGLRHGAPLDWPVLSAMLYREDWAMLHETLEHSMVDGQLTDGVRVMLDEAIRACEKISDQSIEILLHFGYRGAETHPSSRFAWITSLLRPWWPL
jgi:hypothetical protein